MPTPTTIERRIFRGEFRDVPGSDGRQKWATAVAYNVADEYGTLWLPNCFDRDHSPKRGSGCRPCWQRWSSKQLGHDLANHRLRLANRGELHNRALLNHQRKPSGLHLGVQRGR